MNVVLLKHQQKLKNEEGAAAVEFALLLPALTLIIVGIMMFGIVLNYYLETTHAAREGARWAALRAPFSGADGVEFKTRSAAPGLDPAKTTVTMSGNVPATGATDDDQGEAVTVSVVYGIADVKAMFGTFAGFLPDSISSSAVQKVE